MSKKEAYQQKLQAQLNEWKADIDKLKAKADNAGADARIEYHDQIEKLTAKQEAAKEKFQALQRSGEDAWEDLKTGIDSAWDELGKAVKSAKSKF